MLRGLGAKEGSKSGDKEILEALGKVSEFYGIGEKVGYWVGSSIHCINDLTRIYQK